MADNRSSSPRGGGRGQGRPSSDRSSQGRPGQDRSSQGRPGQDRSSQGRPSQGRSGAPGGAGSPRSGDQAPRPFRSRDGDKPARPYRDRDSEKPARSYRDRDAERPARRERDGGESRDWSRKRSGGEDSPRTAAQVAYDGPPLPDHITGEELSPHLRAQLKGMPEKLAQRIARHMVAADAAIDDDPELAYRHMLAAKARAARLAMVREATGEAAYAAGMYDVALAELRAAKRINGAPDYLPIMADCHRALGNPEQAIKLSRSPSVANFSAEAKAEMTLVEAGARRDMGQFDAALRILELAPLNNKTRAAWVVRLRYAYADTLEAAGRPSDALEWFHRTFAIDSDEMTDAAKRAQTLEDVLNRD